MTQMTINYSPEMAVDANAQDKSDSLIILDKSNFSSSYESIQIYDRISSRYVIGYKYSEEYETSNSTSVVNLIFVPNNTFVPKDFVYFDTIHSSQDFDQQKSNGIFTIICYINISKNSIVLNSNKNMKVIINNFYLSGDILRKKPNSQIEGYDWLSFDPSVSMFSMKTTFVLRVDVDHTNTPECFNRSTSSGFNFSVNYKFANKASSNVCSHESMAKATDLSVSSIAICPFGDNSQVTQCPYYQEDKFKISSLELVLKSEDSYEEWKNDNKLSKVIDVYLIRSIMSESYYLLFVEKDLKTNKDSILKRLNYDFMSFNNIDQKNTLIVEANSILSTILMDYTKDYAHKLVRHIEDARQIMARSKTETRVSYISTLKN